MLPAALLAIISPDTIPLALNAPAVIVSELASLVTEIPPGAPLVLGVAAAWVSWHIAVLAIEQSSEAALVRLELLRR
jgi:hypothetical protein